MTATNETLVDESFLLYKILRRIPYGRWISTIDVANELEASGVEISTRRLQRFLKRISSDEKSAFFAMYAQSPMDIGALNGNRIYLR